MTKCPLNSLKVETVLFDILLNHALASPLSVVGSSLHMISSGTPYRCMRDSKWLSRSLDSSYASTYRIQNLAERGQEVTCAMNGELVDGLVRLG